MTSLQRGRADLAWHYTTGDCLKGIAQDQRIKLENGPILNKRERRCVWFSTSATYEPTALKVQVCPDGSTYPFQSAQEQAPHCGGLVRIGVPTSRLHSYDTWRQRSGVTPFDAAGLHYVAVQEGANPERDWFVSFKTVKTDAWQVIEVSLDGIHWHSPTQLKTAA